MMAVTLSREQEAVLDAVKTGRNIMVCGQAGSGKSTVIAAINRELGDAVALSAMTGIAALNIGGSTIHKLIGVGIMDVSPEAQAAKCFVPTKKYINTINTIVVDEVSMMSAFFIEYLDKYLRIVRGDHEHFFGNIQLVLVGDLGQLPPVHKVGSTLGQSQYVFEWEHFDRVFGQNVYVLQHNHRQSADPAFAATLGRIGRGAATSADLEYIHTRSVDTDPGSEMMRLMPTNRKADDYNAAQMTKISEPPTVFKGAVQEIQCRRGANIPTETIFKDHIAPGTITLKPGAYVMLVANIDPDRGLVNGTTGVVESISARGVTFVYDLGTALIGNHMWTISLKKVGVFAYTQMPLKPAWACTVHKSQGLTVDRICIYARGMFAAGQAYTALTRARGLSGVVVVGKLRLTDLKPDDRVLEFYHKYGSG